MANQIVLLDTSILIDYYRKTDKSKSVWLSLIKQEFKFAVSTITKFEIYIGATELQKEFWNSVFSSIIVLPFDEESANIAVDINSELKRKRKQIDMADLFIASVALANNLPISTLNKKHFERIEGLVIIET